jgi:hypothetical protein
VASFGPVRTRVSGHAEVSVSDRDSLGLTASSDATGTVTCCPIYLVICRPDGLRGELTTGQITVAGDNPVTIYDRSRLVESRATSVVS